MGIRRRAFLAILQALIAAMTVLGAVMALAMLERPYGWLAALATVALSVCLLGCASPNPSNRGRAGLALGAVASTGLLWVAVDHGVFASERDTQDEQSVSPPPTPTPTPEPKDDEVHLGVRLRSPILCEDGIAAIVDGGVVIWKPGTPSSSAEIIAIEGELYDIAAAGRWLYVVRGGEFAVYDLRTGRRTTPWTPFSEAPGHVAAGFGSIWLANTTHAKIDRVDPRTRISVPIAAPDSPRHVIATSEAIWASAGSHWLVRIDPLTNRPALHRTQPNPDALTAAAGVLWVSHRNARVLSRHDLMTGEAVGDPIPVDTAVDVLLTADGDVWALSTGANTVQRFDPRTGKLIWTGHVAALSGAVPTSDGLLATTVREGGVRRVP